MSRNQSDVETVVVRELQCTLTDAELLERGDAMAACESAVDELKAERRRLNASIREQSDKRADLAKIIEAKTETRDVSCEWRPDYDAKRYELFRLDDDSAAPVEQRDMPEADLQMRLIPPTPISKGAAAKAAKSKARN